jgi:hypothetical protein
MSPLPFAVNPDTPFGELAVQVNVELGMSEISVTASEEFSEHIVWLKTALLTVGLPFNVTLISDGEPFPQSFFGVQLTLKLPATLPQLIETLVWSSAPTIVPPETLHFIPVTPDGIPPDNW